jgi:GntR family histidine utilization transcriptional repressor
VTAALSLDGWEAVRAEALRRITRRVWAPGDLIPGEAALAEEFGVSRATVSRALRALAEDGLLDRRRKAGTRVAATPARRATVEIPVIRVEVESRGMRYAHRLIERRSGPAPEAVCARLGAAADAPMERLRTLHLADGRPWMYEDRWVHPPAAPGFAAADFSAISVNEWLVRSAPFTDCALSLGAERAGPETAALLEAGLDAALVLIERATWIERVPITFVRQLAAPGYRLSLRM